ncbi:MAG: hypothetical protein JW908_02545 [Anaerolineales bacterium]|nr:hypothetical protein [Anaerolineales bacterium]
MQPQTANPIIRVSEPVFIRSKSKFNFCFDRQRALFESSFKGYSNGDKVLFIKGHPRDEDLRLLTPQAFLKRIEKTFDGILGTTGLYCGVLLDRSTQKLSIFCDPHAAGLLYWYLDENQILISDNLDWVVKHCSRKLHIDGMAWAELLSIHSVLGSRTYFEEIKCVELQQVVMFDLNTFSVHCDDKRWYLHSKTPVSDKNKVYADIAGLFHEGITKYAKQFSKINLALSGGLDSRMMLSSFVKNSTEVSTYTTDTDVGFGNDRLFAALSAREYGTRNQYLELDQDWYENTVDQYYEQTSFESWYHVWFHGFLNNIPNLKTRILFTGNDGDGLLRASHIPAPSDDFDMMFSNMRHECFQPIFTQPANMEIINRCLINFKQEYSSIAGYHASISFFRLNARSRRNIHWMLRLGSLRYECISGFEYPPFIIYVLGLSSEIRFNPTLQFEIMRCLDPHTLTYPSTHKTMWDRQIHTKIRKYNQTTIEKFSNLLMRDSMINMLGYLDTYRTKKLFQQLNSFAINNYYMFEKTQPIYMFARWLEVYQDHIHHEKVF